MGGAPPAHLPGGPRRRYDRCRRGWRSSAEMKGRIMALTDELAYTSVADLALRIRRRQLSPVEVVDAFIARIEARNPSITAFVYCGFDDARQAARQAERAVMSGAALGPLHGVPVAIKDLFDFKPGWVATF